MWFSKGSPGTSIRRAPDRERGRGSGLDKTQLDRVFAERVKNIPEEVGAKLYEYYDIAARLGYESPEAEKYLKDHCGCHPLFFDIAEGLKLMHEDWREQMGRPRKRPRSDFHRE